MLPGILLILFALLPFVLCLWQYQRGVAREAALQAFASAATLPPVSLTTLPVTASPEGQPVSLVATPAAPVIRLANVSVDERPGLLVLQPVRLEDGSVVLLAPGMALHDDDRVPPLPPRLAGRWVALPRHFTLPGAVTGVAGRVDVVDVAALARRLAAPLRQGMVVMGTAPAPLLSWPARPPGDPARHYGYALQWLLMGLCLLMVGVYRLRRRNDGKHAV